MPSAFRASRNARSRATATGLSVGYGPVVSRLPAFSGRESGWRIHVVQPDEIHAQPAQPPGDADSVFLLREIGPEGQVDAEEPHALVVGGMGRAVRAHPVEVAVAHEDAVGGRQRVVQETEVGGPVQAVLVYRERIEGDLRERGECQ